MKYVERQQWKPRPGPLHWKRHHEHMVESQVLPGGSSFISGAVWGEK